MTISGVGGCHCGATQSTHTSIATTKLGAREVGIGIQRTGIVGDGVDGAIALDAWPGGVSVEGTELGAWDEGVGVHGGVVTDSAEGVVAEHSF